LLADQIRRVWAFSERAVDARASRMRPTSEGGSLLRDYAGVVVEFDYHVAVAVLAEGSQGRTILQVLDPSLAGHPVEVDLWHQRAGTPRQLSLSAQVTELGIPPLHPGTGRPFPGSGYRPWPDPRLMTPSQDARALMLDLMAPDSTVGRPARPLPVL
jgi:hypothetical protein